MTAINKNQFSFIDTSKYVSGQATKVFVSMPFPQHKEAIYKEVTLAEPINNGDTFITITEPLDVTLYEWTKLRLVPLVSEIDEKAFGVFVFIETPAGETVIPIHPANGTAPAGKVFRLTSYIPVFSAKSVNIDNQSTMFIENNFSDLDIKTALTGVSASGTIEGAFIFGDPGNAVIQQAIKTARMVQLEVVTSDRKTSDTARVFLSANKQKGVNAFNTISYAWFADRMASENILTLPMGSEFGLSVDKTLVRDGDTFTVTFVGDESAAYTITGVTSADIGGEPLTGTFTASGEQLTFTVVNADKNFVLSLDNGKASVGVPFIGCEPLTVNFSDPLSSSWTIVESLTDGVYGGASYSVDTSGGFWRTTLNFGDNNEGRGANIQWTNGWSYTPKFVNEIINISFSADLRFVSSSNASFNQFAFDLIATQGANIKTISLEPGRNVDWTNYAGSVLLNSFSVGSPINFTLRRINFNSVGSFTPNQTVTDQRNVSVTVNVTCS